MCKENMPESILSDGSHTSYTGLHGQGQGSEGFRWVMPGVKGTAGGLKGSKAAQECWR